MVASHPAKVSTDPYAIKYKLIATAGGKYRCGGHYARCSRSRALQLVNMHMLQQVNEHCNWSTCTRCNLYTTHSHLRVTHIILHDRIVTEQ